jgi:hypothetical protein
MAADAHAKDLRHHAVKAGPRIRRRRFLLRRRGR